MKKNLTNILSFSSVSQQSFTQKFQFSTKKSQQKPVFLKTEQKSKKQENTNQNNEQEEQLQQESQSQQLQSQIKTNRNQQKEIFHFKLQSQKNFTPKPAHFAQNIESIMNQSGNMQQFKNIKSQQQEKEYLNDSKKSTSSNQQFNSKNTRENSSKMMEDTMSDGSGNRNKLEYQKQYLSSLNLLIKKLFEKSQSKISQQPLSEKEIVTFSSLLSKISEKGVRMMLNLEQKAVFQSQILHLMMHTFNHENIKQFQNYYPTILANLFTKFGIFSQQQQQLQLFNEVQKNILKMAADFDHISVIQLINLFAKLEFSSLAATAEFESELRSNHERILKQIFVAKVERDIQSKVIQKYYQKELVMVLWGFHKLEILSAAIFEAFFTQIIQKDREITLKDIAILLSILVSRKSNEKILEIQQLYLKHKRKVSNGEDGGSRSSISVSSNNKSNLGRNLNPRDIILILWGFQKLEGHLDFECVAHLIKDLQIVAVNLKVPRDAAQAIISLSHIRKISHSYHGSNAQSPISPRLLETVDELFDQFCNVFFSDILKIKPQIVKQQSEPSAQNETESNITNNSINNLSGKVILKNQDIYMFIKAILTSKLGQAQQREQQGNCESSKLQEIEKIGARLQQLQLFLMNQDSNLRGEFFGKILLTLSESDAYLDLIASPKSHSAHTHSNRAYFFFYEVRDETPQNNFESRIVQKVDATNIGSVCLAVKNYKNYLQKQEDQMLIDKQTCDVNLEALEGALEGKFEAILSNLNKNYNSLSGKGKGLNLPVTQLAQTLNYLQSADKLEAHAQSISEFLMHVDDDYFVAHPMHLSFTQYALKNAKGELNEILIDKFLDFSVKMLQHITKFSDKRGLGNNILNIARFFCKQPATHKLERFFAYFLHEIQNFGVLELGAFELVNSLKAVSLLKGTIFDPELQEKSTHVIRILNCALYDKIAPQIENNTKEWQSIKKVLQAEELRNFDSLLKETTHFLKEEKGVVLESD